VSGGGGGKGFAGRFEGGCRGGLLRMCLGEVFSSVEYYGT
jgi:hypothetical protein